MGCHQPIVDRQFTALQLTPRSCCLLVVILFSSLCGCSERDKQSPAETSAKIRFTAFQDGEIWIRHSVIQLRFDPEMYCKVYLNEKGKLQSFVDIPAVSENARPAQFVSVNGEELRDFHIDYANIGVSDIGTQFGIGRRLHLTGLAKTTNGIIVKKELKVDLYNDLPELAIISCQFRNADQSKPVQLTKITDNFFRLNANRISTSLRPFDFTFFYGGMANQSHGLKLTEHFSQTVLFEFKRDAHTDGPPFFDFSNEQMGMAVGYLTAGLTGGELTVMTASDLHVEVGIFYTTPRTLKPGEGISTPKSIWMVHRGDYLSPLKRYQQLTLRNERK
jgi:hypothetical protein